MGSRADLDGRDGRPGRSHYHAQDWEGIHTAEGFVDPANGQIVILRSNIQVREGETPALATARVILHERVGHLGINAVLDTDARLKERWTQLGSSIPRAELDSLRQRYPHLAPGSPGLALEWLAHQTGDRLSSGRLRPGSLSAQMWQTLRDWVAQTFHTLSGGRLMSEAALDAHVRELIHAAQRKARPGSNAAGRGTPKQPRTSLDFSQPHPVPPPDSEGPSHESTGNAPTHEYNERHEDSQHRQKRYLQPDDWENPVAGHDARGTAEGATRSLRSVRGGFYTQGVTKEVYETWSLAAGAEISAVEAGRKPLFHDDLFETPEDANEAATRLRASLDKRLQVQAWDTHLLVYDPAMIKKVIATDPAHYGSDVTKAVQNAVTSDAIGELLGYGVRQRQDGKFRVSIYYQGKMLAGFVTSTEDAKSTIEARIKDYTTVLGAIEVETFQLK